MNSFNLLTADITSLRSQVDIILVAQAEDDQEALSQKSSYDGPGVTDHEEELTCLQGRSKALLQNSLVQGVTQPLADQK